MTMYMLNMEVEGPFIEMETKEKILALYCEGMSIVGISTWTGYSPEEVNKVLDTVTPYL